MMAHALDIVAELGPDGRLSKNARRQIAANLRARAAGLGDSADARAGETVDVRVRLSAPVRSTRANALYWAVLGRVALAFNEAGRLYTPDALHLYAKGELLPRVAAAALAETGEAVEYEDVLTLPSADGRPGRTVRTRTTTRLSRGAFSAYVRLIDYHFNAELGLAVDLSDLLDDVDGVRSGRIEEPDDLRTVPFDDAPAPVSEPRTYRDGEREATPVRGQSAGEAVRTLADLF